MSTLTNYNGLDVVTPAPMGAGGFAINRNFQKLSTKIAATDPSATDDSTEGYGIGSRWFNSTTETEWVCTNNTTSAAVWVQIEATDPGAAQKTNNGSDFTNMSTFRSNTGTNNASNITSGTIDNARTTATASNTTSTIVSRDASGIFQTAGIEGLALIEMQLSSTAPPNLSAIYVLGAPSQSYDFIRIMDSTNGFVKFSIDKTGNCFADTFTLLQGFNPELTIVPAGANINIQGLVIGRQYRVMDANSITRLMWDTNGIYFPVSIRPVVANQVGIQIQAQASQTADLQQWQDSSGVALAYISTAGNGGFQHLIGATSVPTVSAGGGAGSSPTINVSGNDIACEITLTTGSSPSAGSVIATITFNVAYGSAPKITFSPSNANAALLSGATMIYGTTTTSGFALNAGSSPLTGSTQYKWMVHVLQ